MQLRLLYVLVSTFIPHVECRPPRHSSGRWRLRRCSFGGCHVRGGSQGSSPATLDENQTISTSGSSSLPEPHVTSGEPQHRYGRVSADEFRLTPAQVEAFHRDGCVTIPNVLAESEVAELENTFDRFMKGEIAVPGKDFCDMSKPSGSPRRSGPLLIACFRPRTTRLCWGTSMSG
jgi:hypothetical protein